MSRPVRLRLLLIVAAGLAVYVILDHLLPSRDVQEVVGVARLASAGGRTHHRLEELWAPEPSRLEAAVQYNPFGTLSVHAQLGAPKAAASRAANAASTTRMAKAATAAASAPVLPPPPTAPPLPFTAVGAIKESGSEATAFLRQNDALLLVRAGEKLGAYRVEAITEQRIEFTYLPLMQRQSLVLSSP